MKKGIQLVALLLAAFMGSCTGGKDKAAVAAQADEKPIVKLADVKVRPVDQDTGLHGNGRSGSEKQYSPFLSRAYRPDLCRSGRPCIQRPEISADGCG